MVTLIWLENSFFPIFGSYAYIEFLPWQRVFNIQFLICTSTYEHQKYLELLKCRDHFFLTQYFPSILSFWAIYCLSLRAIISMIKRDNRLFDACDGKLKRLSICSMPFVFNSNAELWPKNEPKNHHYFTKRNLGVCFCKYLKFNRISIEW